MRRTAGLSRVRTSARRNCLVLESLESRALCAADLVAPLPCPVEDGFMAVDVAPTLEGPDDPNADGAMAVCPVLGGDLTFPYVSFGFPIDEGFPTDGEGGDFAPGVWVSDPGVWIANPDDLELTAFSDSQIGDVSDVSDVPAVSDRDGDILPPPVVIGEPMAAPVGGVAAATETPNKEASSARLAGWAAFVAPAPLAADGPGEWGGRSRRGRGRV